MAEKKTTKKSTKKLKVSAEKVAATKGGLEKSWVQATQTAPTLFNYQACRPPAK